MILKTFRSVSFLLLACTQLPLLLSGQTLQPAAYSSNRIEIPYDYAGGHMISVPGSVGSHKNLQFLVDFGTTYTLLDRHIASERTDGEKMEIRHFSDAIQSGDTLVPELTVGGLVIKDLHGYVVDMTQIPAAPPGVSGVIGLDVLRRQNVTIDFLEKKLVLSSEVYGNYQTPLLKCDSGYAVNASWKGMPVKLVLSTGVEVVTLDEDRIRQKPIKLRGLKKTSLSSNFTIIPVSIFETKELALGEMQFAGPGVLRKMAWPFPNDELDGFLPLLALHSSRVSVDFERNLLFWDGAVSPKETARMTHQPVPRQSLKP
jgi:hypothetical protein